MNPRSPLYSSVESVDTSDRDRHVAEFQARREAQRADPSSPWHRRRRGKRPPCPPAVERAPVPIPLRPLEG
jgi:hypothetical protein